MLSTITHYLSAEHEASRQYKEKLVRGNDHVRRSLLSPIVENRWWTAYTQQIEFPTAQCTVTVSPQELQCRSPGAGTEWVVGNLLGYETIVSDPLLHKRSWLDQVNYRSRPVDQRVNLKLFPLHNMRPSMRYQDRLLRSSVGASLISSTPSLLIPPSVRVFPRFPRLSHPDSLSYIVSFLLSLSGTSPLYS